MRRKKKGSAAFIVVMIMTIILILSFSLIPLTLSSVRQTSMLYGRNRTYYTGEGNMDKMLHYIDVFSERARISAYNKCFQNGGPNLSNSYVSYIYKKYMPDEEDALPKLTYEQFKEKLVNYYKYEFNKGITAFFDANESEVISIVESETVKHKENVIYSWRKLQENIGEYILNNESSNVNVETFNDIDEDSEFYRFKSKVNRNKEISNIKEQSEEIKKVNGINSSIDEYTGEKLIRETFYISSLSNDKTKRNLTLTVEFNPLGKDVPIKKEGNQAKNHNALTYGVICEDNLIAQDDLIINSSVIVGGQGQPKVNSIDSVEYGGIIAGGDSEAFKNIDSTLSTKTIEEPTGKITISKDAFVGELDGSGDIHGGFIETLGKDSKINIKGNSYSHSIVTHEGSKKGNINIEKSAFVADNVSLNGDENNISIKNNLIGFEDGASNSNNHLSSPAIVINKMDKYKNGKLTIEGQIALAGEGFVESLVGRHEGKDVLFKTFETTAIYPNYIAYSNFISSDRFKDFYKQYQIKAKNDEELLPIDMFDKYSVMSSGDALGIENASLKGIEFILSYFTEQKDEISNYDLGSKSIDAHNINLSEKLNDDLVTSSDDIEGVAMELNGEGDSKGINVSHFNYILYANGKMHLSRTIDDKALLDEAKKAIIDSEIGKDIVLPKGGYSIGEASGQLNSVVFPAIKSTLSKRLMLQDVVSDRTLKKNGFYEKFKNKTRLDRCFNWDELEGDISIGDEEGGDAFIRVSKKTITLSKDDIRALKGKKIVFIASEGDVVIDAGGSININGSIISRGNIITRSNDVEITANKETASIIANYEDSNLEKFLEPGVYLEGEKDMIEGITRTVKTNINIINRRQILE